MNFFNLLVENKSLFYNFVMKTMIDRKWYVQIKMFIKTFFMKSSLNGSLLLVFFDWMKFLLTKHNLDSHKQKANHFFLQYLIKVYSLLLVYLKKACNLK